MEFVYIDGKFYLKLAGATHEVKEELWTALMKRERKEQATI